MKETTTQKEEEINKDPVLVIKHVTDWLIAKEMIKFLRRKYNSEEAMEVIATYHILKAIYNSSIIRSYESELSFMAARCKLTVPVLQDYLQKLQKLELLAINGQDISLSVYADHILGEKDFLYDSEGEERLSEIILGWREKRFEMNNAPSENHRPQKQSRNK